MPDIELIPVPLYQPLQPYNYNIDNLPIQGLIQQILQVNNQVDISANDLRTASGTAGTLTARLAVSLNADGTLTAAAVNDTMHLIDDHTDSSNFVRMQAGERAKLSLIASSATNLTLLVNTVNVGAIAFDNGPVNFSPSSTISWRYQNGNLYLDTLFPGIGHRYGIIPSTSDNQHYTLSGGFKASTLRVFINGSRLVPGVDIQVPSIATGSLIWLTLDYTETNATTGTFALSLVINSEDVIMVDYDYAFTALFYPFGALGTVSLTGAAIVKRTNNLSWSGGVDLTGGAINIMPAYRHWTGAVNLTGSFS